MNRRRASKRGPGQRAPQRQRKALSRRSRWSGVAVSLLGIAAISLSLWWLAAKKQPPPRNILLITVDTLRADALGAYGNTAAATPVIDRLASSGVRFDNAHAHTVVTLPSHASILTGRLPTEHGIRDNAGFRLARSEETLATRAEDPRLHHRCVRQRVSARFALRPRAGIRCLRRQLCRCHSSAGVSGTGARGP